jgi:predicted transposase YdaD
VLTGGLELVGPYQFRSVTFKSLERRADGVFESQAGDEPTHLVEFQAQRNPGAWYNLLTKVGLLGEERPRTDVRGILIFLHERFVSLTAEEILAMITHLTPLEETRAYRDIFGKGEAKGKIEGKAEGKAETLLRLLRRRFGVMPQWAERRISAASTEQLDAWLDGIFDADGIVGLIGPEETTDRPQA